ncbi:beta-galactosidase [Streptomyces sp. NPDC021056]|uniref:beta-galactosidase n=1 Tax=Streptomyces sp. NPDC021056 TaxID=3155012 RepID=UPI0033FEB9A3
MRAEPAELNDLLRYWEAATEQGADSGLPAAVSAVSAVPIGAESWAQAPLPVAREMFGVTMNSFSGVMPAFRVGAVRLWDSETRWSQLEPARGVFDFSTLDRLLDGAERQGLPVTFVFGGTPGWAAPNGREAAYREDCRAAPGARPHPRALSGTADVPASAGAYRVEHLDGTARETCPEDAVRITEEPLLVRYR